MKMAMKSAFYESGGLSNMSIEYRIASVADCEELTRLRMKMRGELDTDF